MGLLMKNPLKIYHTDFAKPSNSKKSCNNFSFTEYVLAVCLWEKQGVELSLVFLIVEHKL